MKIPCVLRRTSCVLLLGAVGGLSSHISWAQDTQDSGLQTKLQPNEKLVPLGSLLFHDTSFSNPPGQSCATCHIQEHAFTDGGKAVSEGAIKGVFGSRNTPSLMYAKYAPPLIQGDFQPAWVGGYFWDGRADSLEEQAIAPFFNPLEMNTDETTFAAQLRKEPYKKQFLTLFGTKIVADDKRLVAAAAEAIASFERTDTFSPFTSKFDYVIAKKATFTELEQRGEDVFNQGGMCGECHQGLLFDDRQMFTDYQHHNLTLPTNKNSKFLKQDVKYNPDGERFIDLGLILNSRVDKKFLPQSKGLFRTPTLRNVAVTAPYMHNGVFNTLREVIDFYNLNGPQSRKIDPAEIPENRSELFGDNLELSESDIDALIAFLHTLTDGYKLPEVESKNK